MLTLICHYIFNIAYIILYELLISVNILYKIFFYINKYFLMFLCRILLLV